MEHDLEKAKDADDSSSSDSDNYKDLKKKYEHLKDDHKKCTHTVHELKTTIIALQERLEAKENEIRKIKSTPVHVDVVVRRDKSSDDSDIKVTANKSSVDVKKKFTLSDSEDSRSSRSSHSKDKKAKKNKKPKDSKSKTEEKAGDK